MSGPTAEGISMVLMCRVLNIARQVYYRCLTEPVTPAELEQAYRANALHDAHREDPEFGYRYPHEEATEAGQVLAAWRICSDNRSKNGKRPGPPVHDDLVWRCFSTGAPNELCLTDITEHTTDGGKLYLCPVKDKFSRHIVGNSIDSWMTSRLAVCAVANAVARRRVGGFDVAACTLLSRPGFDGECEATLSSRRSPPPRRGA